MLCIFLAPVEVAKYFCRSLGYRCVLTAQARGLGEARIRILHFQRKIANTTIHISSSWETVQLFAKETINTLKQT